MSIPPGLHERLITLELESALSGIPPDWVRRHATSPETAAELLAAHIARVVRQRLGELGSSVRGEETSAQVAFSNALLEWIRREGGATTIEPTDAVEPPAEMLESLLDGDEVRVAATHPPRPLVPLRQSELIVNGPRDINLGALVERELPSADRVELVISFLRHSGLNVLRQALSAFLRRRPGGLRILTTTYLGATELEALRRLEEMGAELRLSYDVKKTRLHAKSWIFHRDSGFSTALVGSSNLSHAAMTDGREWNVRVSQIDNPVVFRKLSGTFEQYWKDGTFEPFSEERFLDVVDAQRGRSAEKDALAAVWGLEPFPHQIAALDALEAERRRGYHRNLIVAATGTGKTAIAALDFAQLTRAKKVSSLLFIAHRKEILQQSLATFRVAMRDGNFGRRFEPGRPLGRDQHLFMPIQSLHERRLEGLRSDAYDMLVIDEFHHAAAPSYEALLQHLEPKYLVGLTATPERADGKSVLEWFEGRIATELRLWDALDQGLLSPFHYFGLHDDTDLSQVSFRSGRYDIDTLEALFTADHVRASAVLGATAEHVRTPTAMKALGYCVSVRHAEFMAAYFTSRGVPAAAVHGNTRSEERERARRALVQGELSILFTVDLFNEGVDLPPVDTLLFLRPTESATVFLQQLGRGLRLHDGKDCCTVLDFIARPHRSFRFDQRFGSLVRGTRAEVLAAVQDGFPFLPAGCRIQLDAESEDIVLRNIKEHVRATKAAMAKDLAAVGDVGLAAFAKRAELDLDQIYRNKGSYTELLHRSGLRAGPPEPPALSYLERLLHVDDADRIARWQVFLRAPDAMKADVSDVGQLLLFAALGRGREPLSSMQSLWDELRSSEDLRSELLALIDLLDDRRRRDTRPYGDGLLHVHATYSKFEIMAAFGQIRSGGRSGEKKLLSHMGGVLEIESARSELLFVTLDKNPKEFSPSTLYEDYPIAPDLFHWQSQNVVRSDARRGRRYRTHVELGWKMLLFVRRSTRSEHPANPFVFLGPVRYRSHEGERPMSITWRLETPMPASLWNDIKLAAG